jgi:hypothetical protein
MKSETRTRDVQEYREQIHSGGEFPGGTWAKSPRVFYGWNGTAGVRKATKVLMQTD